MYFVCIHRQCFTSRTYTWPLTAALITSQTLQRFPYQNKVFQLVWFFSQVSNNTESLWHAILPQTFILIMNFYSYKLSISLTGREGVGPGNSFRCKSLGIRFQTGRQQGCQSAPWFCLLSCDLPSTSLFETRSHKRAEPGQAFPSCCP